MKSLFFRCGKFRIQLLLCLVVSTHNGQADIIRGRVVDAKTKESVPEASIIFEQRSDWEASTYGFQADSLGRFEFFANGRGTLKVSMLGYYTKTKTVLAFSESRKDTIDLGTIELKMSAQMLKMIEVKAKTRRFTMKGDTIVFHPEAFHLQEGTRLDELIRQLPGVQVDDEERMTWNGKPIRITMNGESLFGGSSLVKQLPAEAVQDIKAYNKQSKFSERTGKDDGTEDMVLDLSIKPGFLDRWYGDLTAELQTPKHYDGTLKMSRLSENNPVMVFANANNVNKMLRQYINGSSSASNNGYGMEQGGSIGYQHNWKQLSGTQHLSSNYSFSGGMAHDDQWNTTRSETLDYQPESTASRRTSSSYQRRHELNPNINAHLWWDIDTLNSLWLNINAEHKHQRAHSRQETEQKEAQQFTNTHSTGHETLLSTYGGWTHFVKEGSLGASFHLNYTEGKADRWTDRTITSHRNTITQHIAQQAHAPSSSLTANTEAHYSRWLTKKWMLKVNYKTAYNRRRDSQDFETNGATDAANSYRDHYTQMRHGLELASTFNLAPVQLMPMIIADNRREHQDYKRGGLDTTAIRHQLIVMPSMHATWKISKTTGLELNYSYQTEQPTLLQTLAYRDDTNPLYITEGNPMLRDTHIHDASLSYNAVFSRHQLTLSATIGLRRSDHDVVAAFKYNTTTGVYTSRPENVRGNSSREFRLNYDQGFSDFFRVRNDLRLAAEHTYGYLIQTVEASEPVLSRQSTFHPKNKTTLSLDMNWLKASVFCELDMDCLRYSASTSSYTSSTSAQNTTLWQNNFGAKVEITYGPFAFDTQLTERTRRGYAVTSMNHNMLVWNGAVTWKIWKNKARVKLYFDDILDAEDNYYSMQNANQQTTTWNDLRHHYIGLSFTYHLSEK